MYKEYSVIYMVNNKIYYIFNVNLCDIYYALSNRHPGLESSKLNKIEEDNLYNNMLLELLQIVLKPIISTNKKNMDHTNEVEIGVEFRERNLNLWECVNSDSININNNSNTNNYIINTNIEDNTGINEEGSTSSNNNNINNKKEMDTWKNLFAWKIFTKKYSNKINLSRLNNI